MLIYDKSQEDIKHKSFYFEIIYTLDSLSSASFEKDY